MEENMNQTEITIPQDAVQRLRRLNGRFWPGKSLDAHAVTRYPNIVAEIDASGMYLWCPAEHANVSPEILAAALEDNEELSFIEVRGLARLYGCKIPYLTAPVLSVVDPTTNKGKHRRRILEELAKQVGPLEHEQFRVENLLGAMGRGDIVTYAVYRQTIRLLLDAANRQRWQQHKPRSVRRRAAKAERKEVQG